MLADLIASRAHSAVINILDVGIGSGEQMYKIATGLEKRGVEARITGIDICIPKSAYAHWKRPVELITQDFSSAQLSSRYEVVNSTQSLYYFVNPVEILRKMLTLVAPSGVLLITVWAEECLLYQLYKKFFYVTGTEDITDRTVISFLGDLVSPDSIKVRYFDGEIDVDAILVSDSSLRAILTILSRQGHISECDEKILRLAREYLSGLKPIGRRRNAIITVHTREGIFQKQLNLNN